jgi:uncharacterized phiE125 gp8 family phage protein
MKRAIITPAPPPPAILAELKDWLGIATTGDDAGLTALLAASLDTCEAFTGLMPVGVTCKEVLPACGYWQSLATRPVQAITQVETVAIDGTRTPLAATDYALDLDASGTGAVRVIAPTIAGRVAVTFTAGLAPDWASLPDALRHGIIRLAAHQYREREVPGTGPLPPASVAALWRPWRRLRVA